MATTTTNLGLTKPAYTETADISVINTNMDTIDTAIKNLQDTVSGHTSSISSLQNSVMYDQSYYDHGRDIATAFASEISSGGYANVYAFMHARAAALNFEGFRYGDYFTVTLGGNQVKFIIIGKNSLYNVGYLSGTAEGGITTPHFVMTSLEPVSVWDTTYQVGDYCILWNTANNNGTASESAPYLGSNLHAWETSTFYNALPSTLRNYLLNRYSLVETRYTANSTLTASTGWKWADMGKVWSLSEVEVYGTVVWGTPGWSVSTSQQFPYFRDPAHRSQTRVKPWWLRTVSGSYSTTACTVGNSGVATDSSTTSTYIRPRPCFLLG